MRDFMRQRGGIFLGIVLAGVLGVAPALWAGTCVPLGGLDVDNGVEMDLASDDDTDGGGKAVDHITGRGPQTKLWHGPGHDDSYWWSILWDAEDDDGAGDEDQAQRFEIMFLDNQGGVTCGETWTETNIPVHDCDSGDSTENCENEDYEGDEDSSDKQRYKRRYDVEHVDCGGGDEKILVLSHRQVSEPDKCSPDCAIHLYRFSRVWRCDDAVQPADECDPSSHSCSGDCDFPSWELDSGFPITVVSDLRIEAGDITNDVDDRIWMVSTELGECSGSPGLCWDNDDCPGAETCDTDAGVVRVRYTDEDCACDSASNCAFDNTDVVLANDLPTDASTSWDDLAAIDANSHYTRVFWSNQETERFMYSEIYNIGTEDPVNDWTTPEVAEAESDIADDHLFVIPDAPQYTFMAVVKTSKTGSTDTLTQLMARSPSTSSCSGGTCSYWGKSCSVEADCDPQWFYHEIAQESSDHTRPSAWYNSLYGCLRYFAVDRDNDESEDFDIVEKHVAINSLTDIFDCGSNSVCVSSGNPCACCNGEGSGSCSGLSWSSQTTLIDRAHKLNDPAPMFWYPPDLDWPDGIGWPADWMVLTADNDFVCDSNNDCEAEDKPCDCCTGENTGNCAGSPDDDTGEYRHWRQRLIPFPPSTTTTTTIPTCSTTSTTTTTTTSTTL